MKNSNIPFSIASLNRNCFVSHSKQVSIQSVIILFLFFEGSLLFSQNTIPTAPVKKQWLSSLSLEDNVFIENKGQFDGRDNSNKTSIQYSVIKEGIEIHFTTNGLTYRYDKPILLNEEEREQEEELEKSGKKEYDKKIKSIQHFIHMNWLGGNPNTYILPEGTVDQYYTYSIGRPGNASSKAFAYQKITYKNIYPNVDVEYTFPEGKPGIKYTLIVYPGADLSAIKMNYRNQKSISMDEYGNIIITSEFGDFVDHAPVSYDGSGKNISSAFELTKDIVSFKLTGPYDNKQKLVIDPWTTNPAIAGYNAAYDIEYDQQGNVYVYGGRSSTIFRVHKYDKTGSIKWIYSQGFSNGATPINKYYGDFAVDAVSESVYIVEAENISGTGARVVKLNPFGNKIGEFPGNPQLTEMWRIVFNNCTKQAIIGGGGAQSTFQACILDTTVTTMTPVNVLNTNEPQHDVCLLALDNSNNCYMAFARSGPYSASFNNSMVKVSANTLAPRIFTVSNNHSFAEAFNIAYVNNNVGAANGFNGIAVSNSFLYTYDGQLIQRWNKNTGALINSKQISSTPFTWGGIAVDECENIYVGVQSSVIKYDINFTAISTITTSGDVYDVRLGPAGKLYVCGKDFVSSFDLIIPVCNPLVLTLSTTSVCELGTASVSVSGGNPGYSYYWSPTGQTTATITGLSPGTYTVTVIDSSSCYAPKIKVDSIKVTVDKGISLLTNLIDAVCGISGSASVTASNGTPGYSYLWSNGQTTSVITGLSSGNYSVTVTDSKGCSKVDTVTIHSSGNVTAVAGPSSSICTNSLLPLVLTASGGINYVWNTGQTTSSISVLPSATTTYTVIVSTNHCADTADVTVTVHPLPVANLSGTNVCFNNLSSFMDLSTGNNTISAWTWNFGDGTGSVAQNPSHTFGSPGTYTVNLIVTNNFGCKDTNTTAVVVHPLPSVNFNSIPVCFQDTTCFNDVSTISSGNITGWSWNFGDPVSGAANISTIKNPCHVFNGPGPFTVVLTVTSDSGCQSTASLPATINLPPVALFTNSSVCLNSTTNFISTSTSSSTDPITTFLWNFGDGTLNGNGTATTHIYTTAGNYTVVLVVTTALGCKDTIHQPITVYGIPIANYTDPAQGCAPLCTTFKDLSIPPNGENIASWEWSSPGGTTSSSTAQNPIFCWVSPGTYDVQLIVTTNHGCKDTLFTPKYITVHSWPVADFCLVPSIAPATEPVIAFCDLWSGGVTHWVWDFGDGSPLDSTNTDPVHSYSASATSNDFYSFNTCLRVQNQYECWDTTCRIVELLPEFMFYIPNTFTPNMDGINDVFFGKSRGVKDYTIWLFDRWGNLVWDCSYTGKNTDWDGPRQEGLSSFCQWNGSVEKGGADMSGGSNQVMQEDVYVWKVKLTDIFDKRHTYIGHVNVVR